MWSRDLEELVSGIEVMHNNIVLSEQKYFDPPKRKGLNKYMDDEPWHQQPGASAYDR